MDSRSVQTLQNSIHQTVRYGDPVPHDGGAHHWTDRFASPWTPTSDTTGEAIWTLPTTAMRLFLGSCGTRSTLAPSSSSRPMFSTWTSPRFYQPTCTRWWKQHSGMAAAVDYQTQQDRWPYTQSKSTSHWSNTTTRGCDWISWQDVCYPFTGWSTPSRSSVYAACNMSFLLPLQSSLVHIQSLGYACLQTAWTD